MDDEPGPIPTQQILELVRPIEGWLPEAQAELLIASVSCALRENPEAAIVEVGSYMGRSTVALGGVVKAMRSKARVYAIDPHEGEISRVTDDRPARTRPTLKAFRRNLAGAGVDDVVIEIQKHSVEVDWEGPIGFLFIDGLHDRESVAQDFAHFEPWLGDCSLVAFHDYSTTWPGVCAVVDKLEADGTLERIDAAGALVLLRYTKV